MNGGGIRITFRCFNARLLLYKTTPVQEIHHADAIKAGVRLLIKREDLNHPHISGNKWWKLKYNLEAALRLTHKTILTFGGAYSNHIYATAAATNELGLRSIGIIRGDEAKPLNATLQFAIRQGMKIHYISRDLYRLRSTQPLIDSLHQKFGPFFLIPEGGSNLQAVRGCAEWAGTELSKTDCDAILLPVGTGGTMAGLISAFHGRKKIVGISVLKNGAFLEDEIKKFANNYCGKYYNNWSLLTEYHHGGYAKVTSELLGFLEEMKTVYNLPLDHVYSGKLLWGVINEIKTGAFQRGTTVLALHTGGLRGATQNM